MVRKAVRAAKSKGLPNIQLQTGQQSLSLNLASVDAKSKSIADIFENKRPARFVVSPQVGSMGRSDSRVKRVGIDQ